MEHIDIIEVKNLISVSEGIRTWEWKYIRYLNSESKVTESYLENYSLKISHLEDDPE